jgi:hypothetical protein
MHAAEKSDTGVVPMKGPNKGEKSSTEVLEGRPVTKGKTGEANCDLYAETRVNIAWTLQATRQGNATSLPEVGAQCGSSARWDLCGGAGQPAFLPRLKL